MKMFKFFPLACAAMMMCACSSEDGNGNGNLGAAGEPQYLAVNIVNVGTTPTRAEGDDYVNGKPGENEITKVRFYFFNADDTPYLIKNPSVANVTGGDNVNWLEASHTDDTSTSDEPSHVEKITQSVLVINGVQAAAPASIVAVVNPQTVEATALNSNGVMRLSQLRSNAIGSTFYNKKTTTGELSGFVMSNSVYANAGVDVCSSLVAGHVTTSAETAEKNPVDLYVERVVAKVTADVDEKAFEPDNKTNSGADKYCTKTAVGKYGDYDVYAVIEGWGLATENGKAEVTKQIDLNWTDGTLGIDTWNTVDYHRSFWERSVGFNTGVGTTTNQPVNHKYTEFKAKMKDELYTLPNTPADKVTDLNNNYQTKLLVAATLIYKDDEGNWKKAEICRYNGMNYLGEDNVKKQVASTFSQYYTSTDGVLYTQLTKDDITFAKPTGSMQNYEVTPTLANTEKQYYTKGSDDTYTPVSIDVVKKAIETNKAEIRKEGKAYYYVPIKHLGKSGELGEYGVVRNHFYKITLTGIKGFGTPVYFPGEVIIPTVPSYKDTYLAARVKVLQWRVVNQNANLGN